MDGVGNELLAASRFTREENSPIDTTGQLDHLEDVLHRFRSTDDVVETVALPDLGPELLYLVDVHLVGQGRQARLYDGPGIRTWGGIWWFRAVRFDFMTDLGFEPGAVSGGSGASGSTL